MSMVPQVAESLIKDGYSIFVERGGAGGELLRWCEVPVSLRATVMKPMRPRAVACAAAVTPSTRARQRKQLGKQLGKQRETG